MNIRKYILFLSFIPTLLWANDTVYVVGGIQHEGLIPTIDVGRPLPKWAKMHYLSNTYLDLGLRWDHQTGDGNRESGIGFQGLELITRSELTEWPMLGYDEDFGGYGLSHLHIGATFDWGKITVGDVYGQFGSGMVLRLYEDRALGVDNALRGGKIEVTPYKGLYITALGGKQRRYWNCYDDHAWGWNYKQDAVLGANLELGIHEWSEALQEAGANFTIGGSYVSKYQQKDTIIFNTVIQPEGKYDYYYNLPAWVGSGSVRAQLQMKGWNALVEYAYKANFAFAWMIGAGAYFGQHVSAGLYYYGLGTHNIDYTENTLDEHLLSASALPRERRSVGSVMLRIGFHF